MTKHSGLTEEQVRSSRRINGENRLSRKKRKTLPGRFLESFGDPMIKILLVALSVNIIFLFRRSSWFESVGIGIAILLATLVGTLSEYGSESAFEKLQEQAARINCRVRRGSLSREIPVDQLVVGDIVLLGAGEKISADGVIIEGNIEVDQSALNGESKEVRKYPQSGGRAPLCAPPPGLFAKGASLGEAPEFSSAHCLFSASTVCAGEAVMRVTKVGDATVYGKIGAEVQQETREGPLKLRLKTFAASVGKIGYIAAALTAAAYFFNVIFIDNGFDMAAAYSTITDPALMFRHIIKMCTLAVTVVVMAVPEGLPMMITVVLSSNMKRMLRDNVLVRKLTGIETAGSLNILFTDKTGTLTKGKLSVTHFIDDEGRVHSKDDIPLIPKCLRGMLMDSLYYNCSAELSKRGTGANAKTVAIGGNATDRAVMEFTQKIGKIGENSQKSLKKEGVIPFDSGAKFMATTLSDGRTFIKGAPEKILPYCVGISNAEKIGATAARLSEQAVRIIAVAVSDTPVNGDGRFSGLKLIGLLGIRDDIRSEAVEGVRRVQGAGIQTVMITGDSKATAAAIAGEVGIMRGGCDIVLTSSEMKALSDEALAELLPDLRVVARALPSDKSRLVRVSAAKGLVVGMTGDGVNDAPALKQADIGFAMGSGTEVAKEVGDIVILDDNFGSIAKAICYGRTVFKSIRKFIIYQMSICMCAVGVTVIGPLLRVDLPITVIQMLWINIVMDTLAGMAFSGEKARQSFMKESPKPLSEPIINRYMSGQIAVNSIYSTLICIFFLKSPVTRGIFAGDNEIYIMTAFFALFMFLAIFISFCARTHELNLADYLAANKPFLWIMTAVTVIQIFIIYFGGNVFRTVPLGLGHIALIALFAATVIPVDALRKHLLKKRGAMRGGT